MLLAHRRALGAFDVPAPAALPLPGGPTWVPIGLMALTALGCAALALPKRRSQPALAPADAETPKPRKQPAPAEDISI
jgi:hypothetical protein